MKKKSKRAALAKKAARDLLVVGLAKDQHQDEGTIEVDDGAIVSEGNDNGAYVQAWVWVDFSGTALDKEAGK